MADFYHRATLGLSMMSAFAAVAPRYGAELRGIEDDANEHSDFWQLVAEEMLRANPPRPAERTP